MLWVKSIGTKPSAKNIGAESWLMTLKFFDTLECQTVYSTNLLILLSLEELYVDQLGIACD